VSARGGANGGAQRAASILSARGLAIGWGGRAERVLASGIDLDAEAGQLSILVGPNGSGKSTLLRTLIGIQAPMAGSVGICGDEIGKLSVEERSRRAASVFTDRCEAGYFTVFDIVAFGRYPYTDARGRLEEGDRQAVRGALAAVGLSGLSSRPFSELSDGERQKAQIARAIAQDCPLLVLDEPTAFLDVQARVEIFHIARRLARNGIRGKAIVLSTHDIDLALRFADRLWLMDGAHRFRSGTPEDLVVSGAVGRAFDGEGFRFDARSGAFRSTEALSPPLVEIIGAEGVSRTWTVRLAERLGLAIAGATTASAPAPIASVRIEESEGGPLFTVAIAGQGAARRVEAASYEELAAILEGLAAR
jgi:iron complex transport system ATP-binding protein